MTRSLPSGQEYLRTRKQRYWKGTQRKEKTLLIDEAITVTGYHRTYLSGLFNHHHLYPEKKTAAESNRPCSCQACLPTVKIIWQALDYPCAERLPPVLLASALPLAGCGEILLTPQIRPELATISRSPLARWMNSWERAEPVGLPFSATLPPVPRRQLLTNLPLDRSPWDEQRLGALEGDLEDVVPGWSRHRASLDRGGAVVEGSLEPLFGHWPYPAWGLPTDSGKRVPPPPPPAVLCPVVEKNQDGHGGPAIVRSSQHSPGPGAGNRPYDRD